MGRCKGMCALSWRPLVVAQSRGLDGGQATAVASPEGDPRIGLWSQRSPVLWGLVS